MQSLRLAIALLVAGAVVFGFGMIAQAPMSPSAVMSGIIDSVQVVPSGAPGIFGRRIPTRAIAVYLPKAPTARVFRLPPKFAALADSLHAADTLQALLGWRSESDTATALRLTRNGAVVLDSGVVLAGQRQERSRTGLAGIVLGCFGIIGLIRRTSSKSA
ncbi:MAG: hypothetical protein ABI742_11025 [Gemmatimonadota bacterium]